MKELHRNIENKKANIRIISHSKLKREETIITNGKPTLGSYNYLESRQTGFTSRYGITSVAFSILATATASHIYSHSNVKS